MPDFLKSAKASFEYTQTFRRDFHKHPELGFEEVRTAGIVSRELNTLGLEIRTGVAQTGVVATLVCKEPGPVVLLRFDMDALPINEETGAEYASQNPGVMHACGHDGHTAIGLTVARMLHEEREHLYGTVKLVFQPAEEGLGGAQRMVAEGVLDAPKPDICLAMHLWNIKPLGWIGVTPGPTMAASDTLHIKVKGRGGHGAYPQLTADPIYAAAAIINSLQSIVSRNVPPLESAVVSVTTIHGGEAHNVIPEEVEMQGTIRTFNTDVRELVHHRIQAIVTDIAGGFNCQANTEIYEVTPAIVNDPGISAEVQEAAKELLPEDVLNTTSQTMGSEDMSFMMKDIPGCYFFVGSANPSKGFDVPHHHPKFDFDEDALPKAAALMATAAAKFLKA